VYKEQIVPSRLPFFLTISGSLEEVGREGNLALVLARVHLVNNKETTIYAPALWFTVTGFKFSEKQSSEQAYLLEAQNNQPLPDTFTIYSKQDSKVIAGWKHPRFDLWYVPNAESTDEMLLSVPTDLYQAIQMKVYVVHSKSKDAVTSVVWHISEDGSFDPIIQTKDGIMLDSETGGGISSFITTLSLAEPPKAKE